MKRMKGKILAILMSLAMVFTMIPMMAQEAYAKGNAPSIVKSGDLDDFAKNAPITTVRLDGSKFTKDNAILTCQMNNKYSSNKYEWGTTSDESRNCVVINDLRTDNTLNDDDGVMLPGSFTLTFKDAAIMRDGTTKDFSATYTPEILMQQNTESYTDSFTIVAFHDRKSGISVQPLSKLKIHFGLRVYITCQVVGDNTDNLNSETFLLVSDGINSVRPEGTEFSNILWASENNNYSEAIKFESGIDGESELYLPYESTLNTNPSEITGINGYNVKFIGSGAPWNSLNHIATVASASGIRAKIWSSAGTNVSPWDTYYLDVSDFTKEHTSSSGEGGKIELWTDGQTHDTDLEENKFRKLAGGTIVTPYTYAVPYGKEVTYRMTPDEGYILDKLHVNGSETNPTNTVYKADSSEVAYYEYHFDSDSVNSGQEISVTWKKYAATTNPIPVRKLITGDVPDKDQEFTVVLESVPVPDAPLDGPASSNVDKISVNVVKGQTEVDSEIPALTFKKPGEYFYNVRELNESATGYTYDDKVYTVRFVIESNPDDPDILICTQQVILHDENEVDCCDFVNNYKAKPIAPKVSGTPTAKMVAKGKTGLTISWNKIEGADGYDIFFAPCNKNDKKNTCKNVKSISGNNTFKWTNSGLKKGTAYKSYVKAYVIRDGKKTYISTSPVMHAYTGGGNKKYTNAKSVTVKKKKVSLKKDKTYKIKAKVNKLKKSKRLMPKSHAPKLRYLTSDSSVATVSKKGKITAKGSGTCTITVFAHNGVSKNVKVTVK